MGLEVAPLLDRNAGNQATSSMNFTDFLAMPFFVNLRRLNAKFNQDVVPLLVENRQHWEMNE